MATSARDLLELAHEHVDAAQPTSESAEAAITALGYLGRALHRLVDSGARDERREWAAVEQLANACVAADAGWGRQSGRLPDLVGAACDLLGRAERQQGRGERWVGRGERWVVAVELATAARRCAELALQHRPYERVPALRWVHGAAVELELKAARRPPRSFGGGVLDRLAPAVDVNASPTAAVLDAVAGLDQALRAEASRGPLPVASALATAMAAEELARLCVAAAGDGVVTEGVASRHAPAGWQVAQAALVRFTDGSERRSTDPPHSVQAALRVHRAVTRLARVPAADHGDVAVGRIARQIPLLARTVQAAVLEWGRQQTVFARAHDLVRRDELASAILQNRAVKVSELDVFPVAAAIRVAERLSAALAADLNGPAGRGDLRGLDADARWAAHLAERAHIRTASCGALGW